MPHNRLTMPKEALILPLPPELAQAEPIYLAIKNLDQPEVGHDQLDAHAALVVNNLLSIKDYFSLYGTCSDERLRRVLLSGESIEPRIAIFGGPTIYATAIRELTGQARGSSDIQRVSDADKCLLEAGFKRGAHCGCAACNGVHVWMGLIGGQPDRYKAYAKEQMGARYSEAAANDVIGCAKTVHASKIFENFNEEKLKRIYGSEAGHDFEVLEDVNHEALTVVRIKRKDTIADVNAIYSQTKLGKGSFIFVDGYADALEHALTSDPSAIREKKLAEHAREMIFLSIVDAVPNKQLYQINIS